MAAGLEMTPIRFRGNLGGSHFWKWHPLPNVTYGAHPSDFSHAKGYFASSLYVFPLRKLIKNVLKSQKFSPAARPKYKRNPDIKKGSSYDFSTIRGITFENDSHTTCYPPDSSQSTPSDFLYIEGYLKSKSLRQLSKYMVWLTIKKENRLGHLKNLKKFSPAAHTNRNWTFLYPHDISRGCNSGRKTTKVEANITKKFRLRRIRQSYG